VLTTGSATSVCTVCARWSLSHIKSFDVLTPNPHAIHMAALSCTHLLFPMVVRKFKVNMNTENDDKKE